MRMGLVHKTRGVVPVVVVASYYYYGSCGCSRVQKSALANLLDFENPSRERALLLHWNSLNMQAMKVVVAFLCCATLGRTDTMLGACLCRVCIDRRLPSAVHDRLSARPPTAFSVCRRRPSPPFSTPPISCLAPIPSLGLSLSSCFALPRLISSFYYLLLTTYYSLLTTYCSLSTTYYADTLRLTIYRRTTKLPT